MLETIIVAFFLAADQITKYLSELYLSPLGSTYPLWDGVFHFTSAHNTGAAFGILAGAQVFFLVATSICCAVIVYVLVKHRPKLHLLIRIALALVLAGAIGNFIDRMLFGYVRDMLDFRLINFAIFNVADSAVCIGVGLLLLDLLFLPKGKALMNELDAAFEPKSKKKKKSKEELATEQQMAGIEEHVRHIMKGTPIEEDEKKAPVLDNEDDDSDD